MQLAREKKTLEDNLMELKSQLGDEEERAKNLGKLKNKYEAIIAELEEKLRKEQEVLLIICVWFDGTFCIGILWILEV